jgi:hypothetical protein
MVAKRPPRVRERMAHWLGNNRKHRQRTGKQSTPEDRVSTRQLGGSPEKLAHVEKVATAVTLATVCRSE